MRVYLVALAIPLGPLVAGAGCAPAPAPASAFPETPVVAVGDATAAPAAPEPGAPAEEPPEPEADSGEEGNIWGDSIGESFGSGGLGLSGVGPGGGGTGEGIGLGSIGGLGHGSAGMGGTAPPKVRTAAAAVVGTLPKDDILRVIRSHTKELRFCYERALQSARPGLEGRVVVRFTVGPDGSVIAHQLSQGLEPALDSCIESVFARMQFPKPAGGGVVVVSYPLIFRSADDAATPPDPNAGSPSP